MRRYFFDIVGLGRVIYDFHGRLFSNPIDAQQVAQLLALNAEVEGDEEVAGGRIEVRDANGGSFFSVVIRAAEYAVA